MKEGGSARRANLEKLLAGIGGRMEAFYFAYGDADIYSIAEIPDATTAMALSLTINASGAAKVATVPLITPEEIDAACRKTIAYRAPGA
jgi:uncharacterized protein with GYD domain